MSHGGKSARKHPPLENGIPWILWGLLFGWVAGAIDEIFEGVSMVRMLIGGLAGLLLGALADVVRAKLRNRAVGNFRSKRQRKAFREVHCRSWVCGPRHQQRRSAFLEAERAGMSAGPLSFTSRGRSRSLAADRAKTRAQNLDVGFGAGRVCARFCEADFGLEKLAFEQGDLVERGVGARGASVRCGGVRWEFCGGGHSLGPRRRGDCGFSFECGRCATARRSASRIAQ